MNATPYLYRGKPTLWWVNQRIMAERALAPAVRAETEAARRVAEEARREGLRVRDIPADCSCSEWHFWVAGDRWVVSKNRRRQGCPWHRKRRLGR